MKKNEAILVRNRGGKLLEIHIIPHGRQEKTRFKTDEGVTGSMEVKTLPGQFDGLIAWLDQSGRLAEVEKMIAAIFKN